MVKNFPKTLIKAPLLGIPAAFFVCFLISFSPANGPLERIIAAFQSYVSELPQEKVYLHLDRRYYAAGETIWLKAYLTAGPDHKLSPLSSTIYVELIDSQGLLIDHIQLFSPNGLAAGQLDLPDSLPSGGYLLRAYTHWMRNFGEEYFFHKQFRIFSHENPMDQMGEEESLDIQFFPEGGQLVNGILSKVAFKAIGSDGLGQKVAGKILENGTAIASFESNQLGMGVFPLLPKPGNNYAARIESIGQEQALPTARDSGIVMSVTNSPASSDVVVKIQTSETVPFPTIFLLAQTRGLVCASSQMDLSKRIAFVRIPKTEFPTGIAQFTALDEEGNPLAERLVFINHQDGLSISVTSDKSVYVPRDSIRIDIETKDKNGKPTPANLSLTVFDSGQIDLDENSENIQSNLLLSSELRGYIESPGYYFNPKNEDRQTALDMLLLTQGWRKLTMKQALNREIPAPTYSIENGLTIRGKLRDKNGLASPDGTVTYLSLYPVTQSVIASSGAEGEFEIPDLIYFDSAQVSLQGKSKNGRSSMEVHLDDTFELPRIAYSFRQNGRISSSHAENFLRGAEDRKRIDRVFDLDPEEIALEEVQVIGKKISEVEEYTGPKIYGGGSAQVQVAGNTGLETLLHPLELVRGRVAGVQVSGSGTEWRVIIQGVGSINSSTDPLILVDDIPIDLKSLHTIPVQEIESYTVWKGPDTAIFGSRGANGAIGFYTKRSKGITSTNTMQPKTFLPNGYHIEREFYSPKYPVNGPVQSKPDGRATLFWAPHIQTDSSGKASLTFYNHDLETTITGEIEGIRASGSPGAARFQYRIEQE